jgi:hypothetical protein
VQEIGRLLLVAALVLAVVGAVLFVGGRLGFGRLPGDIVVRRENFTCFFPIATSILLSLLLTLAFWLFRR